MLWKICKAIFEFLFYKKEKEIKTYEQAQGTLNHFRDKYLGK